MACLETDFLVDLLRKKPEAIKKLEFLVKNNEKLTVTPITVTELFKGAYLSRIKEKILEIEDACMTMDILNYDFLAAKKSGEIFGNLEKEGNKIGDFDSITGAIAVRHGEKLVTRNKKHFEKIKDLETESW